ncbi:MAG: metallophosphoesterase [Candidatus Nanohaloarchaea archaeon]
MKVLLLTDIHGNVENLEKILSRESFDTVLCAGDLSDASEYTDYSQNLGEVLDTFESGSGLVKAVPGNMDPEEESVQALIARRMNIHKKIASLGDFEAVGFGGGITPFGTPFEPSGDEIRKAVETLHGRMSSERKVAVIHQPPEGTELDISNGEHVGSPEVREVIEDKDFDLLVTGHIHEARGVDQLAGTKMVNPGPVNQGFYAVLDTDEGLETELKSL